LSTFGLPVAMAVFTVPKASGPGFYDYILSQPDCFHQPDGRRTFLHVLGEDTWCLVSGPTSKVTLMKAVDELVWANSQMLGCRGIFTVGLLQPLEFDVAVRGPKTG